jgi:hypothetical protein
MCVSGTLEALSGDICVAGPPEALSCESCVGGSLETVSDDLGEMEGEGHRDGHCSRPQAGRAGGPVAQSIASPTACKSSLSARAVHTRATGLRNARLGWILLGRM